MEVRDDPTPWAHMKSLFVCSPWVLLLAPVPRYAKGSAAQEVSSPQKRLACERMNERTDTLGRGPVHPCCNSELVMGEDPLLRDRAVELKQKNEPQNG